MDLVIKKGEELTPEEFDQLNTASIREFNSDLHSITNLSERTVFLLSENGRLFAQGQIIPIEPVKCGNKTFSLSGIGGIISHEKGKGFGKQIMSTIKQYLISHDKTGIGFCMPKNRGFYEACGFTVNEFLTPHLVYYENNKKITEKDGQYVFYHESSDRFVTHILSHPDSDIILPIPPAW